MSLPLGDILIFPIPLLKAYFDNPEGKHFIQKGRRDFQWGPTPWLFEWMDGDGAVCFWTYVFQLAHSKDSCRLGRKQPKQPSLVVGIILSCSFLKNRRMLLKNSTPILEEFCQSDVSGFDLWFLGCDHAGNTNMILNLTTLRATLNSH